MLQGFVFFLLNNKKISHCFKCYGGDVKYAVIIACKSKEKCVLP